MSNYNELALHQKIYDLIIWFYPTINSFPKSQRFVLGQRIENSLIRLLELSIEFTSGYYNKKGVLKKMSIELDKIRALVRIARELAFLGKKKYYNICELFNEIGKMIGGLNSSLKLVKG